MSMVMPVKAGSWGEDVRATKEWEGSTLGRENPYGMTGTWAHVEGGKGGGGRTDKGHGNHIHAARDSRGLGGPGKQVKDGKGGKHRDERWNPSGGGDVQVDECSAFRLAGG